jgi:hypothetical protein
MSSWDADVVTAELRAAAAILNDCCLWQASKWAAEMCNGRSLAAPRKINPSGNNTIPFTVQICICLLRSLAYTYVLCASVGRHGRHARGGGVPGAAACPPCPVPAISMCHAPNRSPLQLLLAKSLCSCREWMRASAALASCRSSTCVFFRNYAKYMAGEKAKCDAEAGRREALESVESSNE